MKRSAADIADWLEARAEELRRNPTKAEAKLFPYLEPLGFKFQQGFAVTGPRGRAWWVIVDAIHWSARLVVEVDGGIHKKRKGHDGRRDRALAQWDLRTVRVSNSAVMADVGVVVERIKQEMASQTT